MTLTGVLGAVALEASARALNFDLKQARAIAVSESRTTERGAFLEGDTLDVAYLPSATSWDGTVLETMFGTCRTDHPGRTLLIYGDSTTVQGQIPTANSPGGPRWPTLLELPDDVQVCALAAEGYHPLDYVELHETLGPALDPDVVAVLLCANDRGDRRERLAVEMEDGITALYEPPTHRLIVPALWQPWLYDRSEAFRFLHWRLAADMDEPHRIQLPGPSAPGPEEPLDTLARMHDGPLVLAFLPPVAAPDVVERPKAKTPLRELELGPNPLSLRREPTDSVHLNSDGHRHIAPQLQVWIDAALDEVD